MIELLGVVVVSWVVLGIVMVGACNVAKTIVAHR